jgi:hypothetical protein
MASSILFTQPVRLSDTVQKFTATITAHTDGTVTSVTTPFNIDGYVMHAEVNPGTIAPQADYDIAVNNSNGVDVFGAELNNRSATVSEQAMPKIGGGYGERYVDGPVEIAVLNNNVSGAISVLTIYFRTHKN